MLNLSGIAPELGEIAQRLWEQCEASIAQQGLSHPKTLLPVGDVSLDLFSRQLTRAFVGSEFIAKTCALRPAYLVEQMAAGELFQSWTDQFFTSFTKAVQACTSDVELDACLRQFRQRAMVRLIWRDLNRLDSMQQITGELSRFADLAITLAADFHYRALEKLYGAPIGKETGKVQPFMVLGMGKLGAGELNISSDIDLIFTFPEGGDTRHETRSIGNQEFFIKLGQRLINSAAKKTADDFFIKFAAAVTQPQ